MATATATMTRDELLRTVLDRIKERTGHRPQRTAGGWLARCPAHKDTNPSLSVAKGDKGIVFRCWADCSFEQVAAALGFEPKDLFYHDGTTSTTETRRTRRTEERQQSQERQTATARPQPQEGQTAKRQEPPATLTVAELAVAKGFSIEVLQGYGVKQVGAGVAIPYRLADGSPAPRTRLRFGPDYDKPWAWSSGKGDVVPYGLWRLAEAREAGHVVLVEGESDCWTLWEIGVPALGIPGALMDKTLKREYLEGIGRLYVVQEPGKAGASFVERIGKRLQEIGWTGTAKVVTCEPHKDPNALYQAVGDFQRAWRDRMDAATPLPPPSASAPLSEAAAPDEAAGDAAAPPPPPQDVDARKAFFDGRTFVPARLSDAIRERGLFCYGYDPAEGVGRLMEYRAGVWRPAVTVKQQAQVLLGEEARRSRVDEAHAYLERDADWRPWPEWNVERRLVNCLSGMLDPVTLELSEHRPDLYSTFQIGLPWKPDAECELLETFLVDVLPADAVELAMQMLGYLLIPDLSARKFFVLQGPTATGKTTFVELVKALVGEDQIAYRSLQDLADNRFATASLENRLLVLFDDMDATPLRGAAVPKVLTGGFNRIKIERKGADAYSAPLYARLLFACNAMPSAPDKSPAWYSRLCLLPFTKPVPTDKRVPDFHERLTTPEALGYLFALAVSALQDLIARNMQLPEPESVRAAMAEYMGMNDTVAAFVDEGCTLEAGLSVLRTTWAEAYRGWCHDAELRPTGRNRAYRRLCDGFPVTVGKLPNGRRVFKGLALKAVQGDGSFEGQRHFDGSSETRSAVRQTHFP